MLAATVLLVTTIWKRLIHQRLRHGSRLERLGLLAAPFASGLLATSAFALDLSFQTPIGGDSVAVSVSLSDVAGGGAVEVSLSIPAVQGDLLGLFGNLTNESLASQLAIEDASGSVTQWQFQANQVWKVGAGNNVLPIENWDWGVRFATAGSAGGALESVSFRLVAPGLSVSQLVGAANQGWLLGVRVQSTTGATGSAKVGLSANAPIIAITVPTTGALLSATPAAVSGSVSGTSPTVDVNGVAANVGAGSFDASVPLSEGANTLTASASNALGSSTDSIEVTLDSIPPVVSISAPADGIVTDQNEIVVSGTVADASEITSLTVAGQSATLTGGAFSVSVVLTPLANTIAVVAVDAAGNEGQASVSVTYGELPTIAIGAPADGALLGIATVTVTGPVTGIPEPTVAVNGVTASVSGGNYSAQISLSEGSNAITATATNAIGQADATRSVTVDTTPPAVSITSPSAGSVINAASVQVTGTATDASAISSVSVNGVAASVTGSSFSATVPLADGANTLTATAVDAAGNSGNASIGVERLIDTDGDGVADSADQCPNTPPGASVDTSGCATSQLDDDGDGVSNGADQCASTPTGQPVNAVGCSASQLDSDGDGISDEFENQVGMDPNDPNSTPWDFDGDGIPDQLDPDDDNDGVPNEEDRICPETSPGLIVDELGCPIAEQIDADGDGVPDVADLCDNTPAGEPLRPGGCSFSQSDTDGDGVLDPQDPDIDGDGVLNESDRYPTDAGDWQDSDQDGWGDNRDRDIDGDGVPNDVETEFGTDPSDRNDTPPDLDRDGVPDSIDSDIDGDGVENAADPFENDRDESVDSDEDGIGDNADQDRDGDGFTNDWEMEAETDPEDPNSRPSDADGDFIPDAVDPDRDGDGESNNSDRFPDDPLESRDLDRDGIGDNSDPDRDGDGVENDADALPDNRRESSDLDGDGTGDNGDFDRDGDGVPNRTDAFPDDPSATSDLDADGIADGVDPDRDGDGIANAADLFPNDPRESVDLDGDGIGDNADLDRDGDGIDDDSDAYPDDATRSSLPIVRITNPPTLTTLGSSPIQVTGIVDSAASALTVNGMPVSFASGTFTTQVALEEGHNTIVARMVDAAGTTATASVSVSLDTTPPYVTVESHRDGQVVYGSTLLVTGLVNDIVRGTVEANQAVVTVNGINASVSNRSYSADGIALVEGDNTITVVASDQVGNVEQLALSVRYEAPTGRRLERLSGHAQSAMIGSVLASPLVLRVLDDVGTPVANEEVVFRVIQGSGTLGNGSGLQRRAERVATDSNGIAQVNFQLGQRSGSANHKVRAQVVGYRDEIVFSASGLASPADKLTVNSGNNQRGGTHQPLPSPFVVAAIDAGSNVVHGARVAFQVLSGGGQFENGLQALEVITDSDGRATAHLTLGGVVGLDSQRVKATLLDKATSVESEDINAVFTASAFEAGDPGQTSISGLVLDNQLNPVPGVTVRVDGTSRQAVVDTDGKFAITEVPVGPVHLVADGSTATVSGEFPSLSQNLVTVAGAENPLPAPIYMVKLNTDNAVYAGLEDVEITLPNVPGFKFEVPAGSVTFPGGSSEGFISVTAVNASAVPMAPPNGMQPQFIVTIQPTGAMFDPPARITLPNVDGHARGEQVEMFSYDHDLEEFVAIGLGTVSEDGTVIASNPGVGIVKAGWHCGAQPGVTTCCSGPGECDYCTDLDETCTAAGCRLVPERVLNEEDQQPGNCSTETCGGGSHDVPNPEDRPVEDPPNETDCRMPSCNDDEWEPADETSKLKDENFCQKCDAGEPVNDDDAVPPESEQTSMDCQKVVCEGGMQKSVHDPSDPRADTNSMDCQTPICHAEGFGSGFEYKDESSNLPECKECNPAIPGRPKSKADGSATSDDCKICLGGEPTVFLSEPLGPSYVCFGSYYQYTATNRHPSATMTFGGAADPSGFLGVTSVNVGDTLTVTVEAADCEKSRNITVSDGRPDFGGAYSAQAAFCVQNSSSCGTLAILGDRMVDFIATPTTLAALGGGRWGGCADAARHVMFNALGTANPDVGEADMHAYSNARESDRRDHCEDNNMDLANNDVGLQIAKDCGNNSTCIRDRTLDALENGELVVFSENATNRGVLVSSGNCNVNRSAVPIPQF